MVVQGIPKESWDRLLRPDESPFLEHDWLYAMEKSKCATVDTGAWDALAGDYSSPRGVFAVQQQSFLVSRDFVSRTIKHLVLVLACIRLGPIERGATPQN